MVRKIGLSVVLVGLLFVGETHACGGGGFGGWGSRQSTPAAPSFRAGDVVVGVGVAAYELTLQGRQDLYLHTARTLPGALVDLVTAHERQERTATALQP